MASSSASSTVDDSVPRYSIFCNPPILPGYAVTSNQQFCTAASTVMAVIDTEAKAERVFDFMSTVGPVKDYASSTLISYLSAKRIGVCDGEIVNGACQYAWVYFDGTKKPFYNVTSTGGIPIEGAIVNFAPGEPKVENDYIAIRRDGKWITLGASVSKAPRCVMCHINGEKSLTSRPSPPPPADKESMWSGSFLWIVIGCSIAALVIAIALIILFCVLHRRRKAAEERKRNEYNDSTDNSDEEFEETGSDDDADLKHP